MVRSHSTRHARIAALGLALAAPIAAEEVTVFAAASLTDALQEAVHGFEAQTGHKVVFNVGSSNDLARQIRAGAPADIFFSADEAQMNRLEGAGLVKAAERLNVLSNTLVVVVPVGSSTRMSQPTDLLAVKHLALADPEGVPAGVYARTWLESIGVWARLKDKVVPTLNVRAALSAVESENADAGIVYRTDAAVSRRVKVAFEAPREQGPAIVYSLAPLVSSKKAATAELVRYLVSAPARDVYFRYGFIVLPVK
jgi:molybdate transport system substrate-binding protein